MNKRKGFTLVELLVVISIIALLMSMLMPALNKAKEQAKRVWCLSNERGVMLCTRTYTQGNEDYLPYGDRDNWYLMSMIDLPVLLISEGADPRKFHCPGDIRKPSAVAAHLGGPLADGDWLGGVPPAGVGNPPEFSYYWPGKMFNEVGANRLPAWPVVYKRWRFSDVRHPARLIAYGDLNYPIDNEYQWAHCPRGKGMKGIAGGFLDGHAKFNFTSELDMLRQQEFDGYDPTDPLNYGPDYYHIGLTVDGIKGYDVK